MSDWRPEGDIAKRPEYQTVPSPELRQRQTEIIDSLDLYLTNSDPFTGVSVEYVSDGDGLIIGRSSSLDTGGMENTVAYFDMYSFSLVEVSLPRKYVTTNIEAYCLVYNGRRRNGTRPDYEYHVSINQTVGVTGAEPNFTSDYTVWVWPGGNITGRVKHLNKVVDDSGEIHTEQQKERDMSVYDYRQLELVLDEARRRELADLEVSNNESF